MRTSVIVLVLALSSIASAQGVKVQKALTAAKATVEEAAKDVKTKCGVAITAKLDASFGADEDSANKSAWCADTLKAVATVCEDADYKPHVVKAIKSVECKYDKAVTKDTNYGNKFELKGSTLVHGYNKDSFNIQEKTVAFVKSKFD